MSSKLALVADIGGTHARFALADAHSMAPLRVDSVRQFEVAQFPSLSDAAQHYLEGVATAGNALGTGVFAIAGRIDGDEARITNHPWIISCSATARALGLPSLRLVNDFAAQAMATPLLTQHDLASIGNAPITSRSTADRTYGVLGPGTGLGVSALVVRDGTSFALETEGGHVSFAADDAEEMAILERLRARFGRISNERLVSGSGLVNIHRALGELAGVTDAQTWRPQDVSAGAAAGDARCVRAVELFCAVFGSIAGDLVLTFGAWDGVFLTGGLVPRLLANLQCSAFRQRFEAKGRFASAMAQVPTLAVINPHAGLVGAAAFAAQTSTATARAAAGVR